MNFLLPSLLWSLTVYEDACKIFLGPEPVTVEYGGHCKNRSLPFWKEDGFPSGSCLASNWCFTFYRTDLFATYSAKFTLNTVTLKAVGKQAYLLGRAHALQVEESSFKSRASVV